MPIIDYLSHITLRVCWRNALKWLNIVGVSLAIMFPYSAQAVCEFAGNHVIPVTVGGSVAVPLETEVGQVFKTLTYLPGRDMLKCHDSSLPVSIQVGTVNGRSRDVGNHIIETTWKGLGVRVTLTFSPVGRSVQISSARNASLQLPSTLQTLQEPAIKVELVKTSTELKAGYLPAGTLFSVPLKVTSGDLPPVSFTLQSEPLTLKSTGCLMLDSTQQNVQLPDVSASHFTHSGATDGDTSFELSMVCAHGQLVNMLTSGVEITERNSDFPGVLKNIATTSPASGVGIQILFNGHPVSLNAVTPHTLQVNSGHNLIPFSARYYQTDKTISAGNIESILSVTLNYE